MGGAVDFISICTIGIFINRREYPQLLISDPLHPVPSPHMSYFSYSMSVTY